ncbi:hypothetical protein Tco_1570755 [Tanacetum coccineum]
MNKANQQASVKAVDEICVTRGGPHPYYECLATDSNTFNAYAATGTYNQGGPGYRPQGDPNYRASNLMGPPGFPPPNVQNNQNYNRYNQNQGRGQNFNQGNNNFQALNFQALVGPSNELTNYMKSNEATLRAMQTQMTNMKTRVRDHFLVIPLLIREEVERETEVTKDKVKTTSSESIAHVQPLVVQYLIPEPEVTPKPKPKPSIPYPSRLNDQKLSLIDVHGEELTLRVNDEAITFKVGHTYRYSRNYYDETVHQVNVIDVACEEYAQEVLRFSDSSTSGNPTPSNPIIASSSPSFTPFEGGDFILEEIEACLLNDSVPPGIDDADFDPEGNIRLLEKLLNDDPSSPPPQKELNFEERKSDKNLY